MILAWLSVPVCGSIMLRDSYADYLAESRIQRKDCLDRAALLGNYIAQSGQLADQVLQLDSLEQRREWERNWAAMQRQLAIDSRDLRSQEPLHYPATDGDLVEAEDLLKEQMEKVKEAQWKRDAYIKSANGMFELAQQITNTKLTAAYYKRIGAEGIYLRIQEDLAQLEETYNQRSRDRNRLNREVSDMLTSADRMRRDIKRTLNHLSDKLAEDERLTFRSRLHKHLQEFQLRREFERLITGR